MVAASANFQSIRCARISFEHITQRKCDFLIALMHCVFLACVRVWRRLAWVCRHTFYIMVYLCVFRYRL